MAFGSRTPQTDLERLKAGMAWQMPWYTVTAGFDADFGVGKWHGTNVFFSDGERVFRPHFINHRSELGT